MIDRPPHRAAQRGFTLMEVLVTLTVLALVFAIVVPNLGAIVPSARLEGSGKLILRQLDWVRSEARIQGKRMHVDFDLDRARWRIVWPPEQQLTRDQEQWTLEERPDDWEPLQTDVVFAGVGDAKNGLATRGVYRLTFDEYGFTGDQQIVLKLKSDETMTWSLTLAGLSGRTEVESSERGEVPQLQSVGEGAF
ncbi:MAG: prepilin-type N-terminal cleavage/methylation domain-containing protein [Planctomycetes bacterium]|nr:prepilin-type N-terminal cleavage/methylation domain-containing protein [Planctomycetota bacterium]